MIKLIRKEEMFILLMHSTHFIYSYMVNDHIDCERRNPLMPLYGLLFWISSKGSFICTQIDSYTSYTFVITVVEH